MINPPKNIPEVARRPHVTVWIEALAVAALIASACWGVRAGIDISENDPDFFAAWVSAASCLTAAVALFAAAAVLRLLARISQQLEVMPMASDLRRLESDVAVLAAEPRKAKKERKKADENMIR